MTGHPRNRRGVRARSAVNAGVGTLFTLALAGGTCDVAAPGPPAPGASAFIDVTARAGSHARIRGWGGLAAFDYDNDGDLDVLFTNGAGTPNVLLENDGAANFTEVAARAGLQMTDHNVVCCGVGDLNNDGRLDLVLGRQPNGAPAGAPVGVVILLNNGPDAGGAVSFTEAAASDTGLTSTVPAGAIGVGDLDNDGLLDLLIGRYDFDAPGLFFVPIYDSQPNELWRCTGVVGGVPRYERVTDAGIEGTPINGFSPDTASQTFIPGTFALYLSDADGDGRLDIFDVHDVPGFIDFYHNEGNMRFTRSAAADFNQHGSWMGIAGGDYDADGDTDYFVTNGGCDFNTTFVPNTIGTAHLRSNGTFFHKLLRNDAGALVNTAAASSVAPSSTLPAVNAIGGAGLQALEFGFGVAWIDADNAGRLDLYWVGDILSFIQPGVAFNWHGVGRFVANTGNDGFEDRTAERGLFNIPPGSRLAFGQQEAGRAVAACDLNSDGYRDLIVTNSSHFGRPDASARIFLNPGTAGNHWLTVRLVGSASNRSGIGAKVSATAGGRTQLAEVVSTTSAFCGVQPEAHFGLGSAAVVDRLEVRWPSGAVAVLTDVAADRVLTVNE